MPGSASTRPWFIAPPTGTTSARVRLLCLPWAGGSAAAFHTWNARLGPEVEVWPVELPGRGARHHEPAMTDMRALVRALVHVCAPLMDRPYALFGHSLGGLVSFELARALRAAGHPEPVSLIVSGARAPHKPPARRPLHALPGDELLNELRQLGGTPTEILDCTEMMQMLLPTMRADLALSETYRCLPAEPLGCPITVLGGEDDTTSPPAAIAGWQRHTAGPTRTHILPGDHFFILGALDAIHAHVLQALLPGDRSAAGP